METRAQGQTGNVTKQVTPERILNIGTGFFQSKALLTAVNLNLFTLLGEQSMSRDEIKTKLGLHGRGLYDFLDTLVSMGFLEREGFRKDAVYSNSDESRTFLDKNKPTYAGGILEMANNRLYPFWNNLEEGLKTGLPQNELKTRGNSLFEELYKDPKKTREFINAMAGVQLGNFSLFASKFDFSPYRTLADIGGAGAHLSMQVVTHNPDMRCISLDLPPVSAIANENVNKWHLTNKIEIASGDFDNDPFPRVDVILMGNILHGYGTDDKKRLIKKSYDSLREGGSYVVIENFIDNERRENTFGLLMSLNMLIESPMGYNMTVGTFECFARDAGFRDTYRMPLVGSASAMIAVK
jgi:precorrin-6B methylase 2